MLEVFSADKLRLLKKIASENQLEFGEFLEKLKTSNLKL